MAHLTEIRGDTSVNLSKKQVARRKKKCGFQRTRHRMARERGWGEKIAKTKSGVAKFKKSEWPFENGFFNKDEMGGGDKVVGTKKTGGVPKKTPQKDGPESWES